MSARRGQPPEQGGMMADTEQLEQQLQIMTAAAYAYKRERDAALAQLTRLRALLALAADVTAKCAREGEP